MRPKAEPSTAQMAPETLASIRARLDAPQPSDSDGYWWEGTFRRLAWTAAGFLKRGDRYVLVCGCGERRDAPLQQLVDAGRGDWPMHRHRWVCSACGGREIAVVLRRSQDGP